MITYSTVYLLVVYLFSLISSLCLYLRSTNYLTLVIPISANILLSIFIPLSVFFHFTSFQREARGIS